MASSHSPTIAATSAVPSMPIFTASMVMSSLTAYSCSARKSAGGTCTPRTPRVFWAVSAVTAPIP